MNPLNNHRQSLILGIVLALLLAVGIGGTHFNSLGLARWFHIVSGVFWIGLLYYFNVAQTPAMADAAADKGGPGGAAINKYVLRGPCSGSAGRPCSPGSAAPGCWGRFQKRIHLGAHRRSGALALLPCHRHRRLARHDHAVERMGRDLAGPEEDPRHRPCDRRGEGQGTPGGAAGFAHEFRAVDPMLMCMASATHGLPFLSL